MSSRRAAVLAVDSGATKIDAALVGADGRVIAAVRGRGTSFSPEDHDRSVEALVRVLRAVAGSPDSGRSARPLAEVGVFCLAGDDLPVDDRRLTRAMRGLGVADRRDRPQRHVRGAARGHRPPVGRRRRLRHRPQLRGRRPERPHGALRRARPDLGRRGRRRLDGRDGARRPPSAAATAAGRRACWSAPCPRTSACARRWR